jgi:hypothetical protein
MRLAHPFLPLHPLLLEAMSGDTPPEEEGLLARQERSVKAAELKSDLVALSHPGFR